MKCLQEKDDLEGNKYVVILNNKERIKVKKILITLLFIALSITLYGCAPKGDPTQTITSYYQATQDGNIDTAYSFLASEVTKNLSKADFTLYCNLLNETQLFKNFKISKVEDDKNNTLNGITFKNIAAFDVTETILNYYDNKEQTLTSRVYVVGDNDTWKVYRTINKKDIALEYGALGSMYQDGKGKSKDLVQAVENYKKSCEYFDTTSPHYALSTAYLEMNRYDDSISQAKQCIAKSTDNKEKSSAMNVIGMDYVHKNDMTNAKLSFEQALKLDPNDEYAKNNMEQYIK